MLCILMQGKNYCSFGFWLWFMVCMRMCVDVCMCVFECVCGSCISQAPLMPLMCSLLSVGSQAAATCAISCDSDKDVLSFGEGKLYF